MKTENARVIQIGNWEFKTKWPNPNQGRVYDVNGIAPTLNCSGGVIVNPTLL